MNKLSPVSTVLFLSLLLAGQAHAQSEYPVLDYDWRFYLGGFNATVNSKIGVNGDDLEPVPPIDIEDGLGVDESEFTPWGGVAWHFAPRHLLELEYFALNRSAATADTFSPPIQFGDLYIEAGSVGTTYDTSVARLTYGYNLFKNERSSFALLAGLHIASLDVNFELAGAICGPNTVPTEPPGCPVAQTGTESEEVTAPLPHFGASYTYAFTPTIAIDLAAMGFAIELDAIDGSLIEVDADLIWQAFENVGFGLGLRYFDAEVKGKNSDLNGEFGFEYVGPSLYVQGTF